MTVRVRLRRAGGAEHPPTKPAQRENFRVLAAYWPFSLKSWYAEPGKLSLGDSGNGTFTVTSAVASSDSASLGSCYLVYSPTFTANLVSLATRARRQSTTPSPRYTAHSWRLMPATMPPLPAAAQRLMAPHRAADDVIDPRERRWLRYDGMVAGGVGQPVVPTGGATMHDDHRYYPTLAVYVREGGS